MEGEGEDEDEDEEEDTGAEGEEDDDDDEDYDGDDATADRKAAASPKPKQIKSRRVPPSWVTGPDMVLPPGYRLLRVRIRCDSLVPIKKQRRSLWARVPPQLDATVAAIEEVVTPLRNTLLKPPTNSLPPVNAML